MAESNLPSESGVAGMGLEGLPQGTEVPLLDVTMLARQVFTGAMKTRERVFREAVERQARTPIQRAAHFMLYGSERVTPRPSWGERHAYEDPHGDTFVLNVLSWMPGSAVVDGRSLPSSGSAHTLQNDWLYLMRYVGHRESRAGSRKGPLRQLSRVTWDVMDVDPGGCVWRHRFGAGARQRELLTPNEVAEQSELIANSTDVGLSDREQARALEWDMRRLGHERTVWATMLRARRHIDVI